jgi:ABC-2 type transport system permease protein
MDRLIALVELRVKLELRQLWGQRSGILGLLLVVPFLLFGTAVVSTFAYLGVRWLVRADPVLALPVLSAAATMVGLLWALSPLLSGLAMAETHDLSRLLFFPVPFSSLLASSLVANLLEPATLMKLPVVLAACAGLGGPFVHRPFVLLLGLLAFVLTLAIAQTMGLVLHALHRNRRLHDRAMFVGLGLGFLLSLLPFLVLYGGRSFRLALHSLVVLDVFVVSPWAWPVRGAVHASRGEPLQAVLWGVAGTFALVIVVGRNAVLARRLYEGDLELGPATTEKAAGRRFVLPGEIGALFEKDLLLYWRDPRLKAMLFTSVMSPVLLLLLWSGAAGPPRGGFLVFLAAFSGLSALGGNAFALERRGLLLLLSFPVDRFAVLVGKNLAAMALRLPSLLALAVVAAVIAPGGLLLPLLAIAVITLMMGAAALLSALLMFVAVVLASPFMLLAYLPVLLEDLRLLVFTLPLAVVGAASCYLLLVKATSGLLTRREPELLARVLAEE